VSQVTIYLDNSVIDQAKAAAVSAQTSLSRWMADLVKEKMATPDNNGWPADFWEMAGAWRHDAVADFDAMRTKEALQAPREPF
jgi:hypothetical protein